jgi:hypothetical protein
MNEEEKQLKEKFNMLRSQYPGCDTVWNLWKWKSFIDLEELISNPKSVEEISPVLVQTETSLEKSLYYNFLLFTTKFPARKAPVGKTIRYFVKNEFDNKFLGIIEVTGNMTAYETARKILGYRQISGILNIRAAMPMQPFGHNFTGGKLFTYLAISDIVLNDWKIKYDEEIRYFLTMALYKVPNQYTGLKYFKRKHDTKKGRKVYWCDMNNVPDNKFETLVDLWKTKHAEKRFASVAAQNKLGTDVSLNYLDLIWLSWPEVKEKHLKG